MQTENPLTLPPWKDPAKVGLVVFTAFIFQLIVLTGMTAKGLVPRFNSDRVRFEVVPVDPRDMMRGEYIILGYEFSRLPNDPTMLDSTLLTYMGGFTNNNPGKQKNNNVYISLKLIPLENIWKPTYFAINPPEKGRYIKGKIESRGSIKFGIEALYVQEGKGILYEQAVRDRKLVAEVYLAPDGSAQMKTVHILDTKIPN